MINIAIIHFQPLEYFPPALNFIRYLEGRGGLSVSVLTTTQAEQPFHMALGDKVNVHRFDMSNYSGATRIRRALKYIGFTVAAIRRLLAVQPETVIYFDPYSALPGIFYKLIFNRQVKIWIHFHEYFAPEWYSNGMIMTRIARYLERRFVFGRALGISHTNSERIQLFLDDNPTVDRSRLFAFPNFPAAFWERFHRRIDNWGAPTRFVALGSFTLNGTYLGEFCKWVEAQNGAVELDVYSLYFDEETKRFLESRNSGWVRFHPKGIPYDQVPAIFQEKGFHVGLVLYRCNHVNTIYCVSNKVFEYLVCGLDVWYPRQMIGTSPYATDGTYPKLLPIDFERLGEMDLSAALSREGHRYVRRSFDCESVYKDWTEKLLESV